METWKPIPGYESVYEVSDNGRVRRIARHLLTPITMKRNYKRVTLYRPKKYWAIHRLVMLAFIGPCPSKYNVNHKDGDPSNNSLDNLEYVTQSDNLLHAFRVLKIPPNHRGEKTHFAKLTDRDVIQIRRLRSEGQTYANIAAQFNTKPANVWHICQGRTWKHLL